MKKHLIALAIGFAPIGTVSAATPDIETARITQLVSSIPLAVDLANYDLAQAAFAPTVTIDYTSLWGGTPQTMTPEALMAGWRGIVPGFDATFHELSDVQVSVTGDTAVATAKVDGRHWIGTQVWRPIGTYRWSVERQAGVWKVTTMTFTMTQEIGDRALAQQAMARAASR
jgi:hypothetical protein